MNGARLYSRGATACGSTSGAAGTIVACFSRSSRISLSRFTATSRILAIEAPVPAGISRPTMTFSLRPSSGSTLPLTAASVSTRVVSWNEAAQHRRFRCRFRALFLGLGVDLVELDLVDLFAGDHVGFALVGDLHLLQHLTDNHLDVLVVDEHALQPVDLLDFVDQIGSEFLDALDRQNVV